MRSTKTGVFSICFVELAKTLPEPKAGLKRGGKAPPLRSQWRCSRVAVTTGVRKYEPIFANGNRLAGSAFIIEPITAKDICHDFAIPSEEEVLFPSNSQFLVQKTLQTEQEKLNVLAGLPASNMSDLDVHVMKQVAWAAIVEGRSRGGIQGKAIPVLGASKWAAAGARALMKNDKAAPLPLSSAPRRPPPYNGTRSATSFGSFCRCALK